MLVSIGNDLVDLSLEKISPKLHQRFINRVFCDSEKQIISSSENLIWLIWAAKEAAYKAIKRLDSNIYFSPINLEFDLANASIKTELGLLFCSWTIQPEYIHLVCCSKIEYLKSGQLQVCIEKVPTVADPALKAKTKTNHEKDLSDYLKKVAKKNIADTLALQQEQVEISYLNSPTPENKSGWSRIPCLLIDSHQSPDLLSFSHHGNYVAYSWLRQM